MKVALCLLFGIVAIQASWINDAPDDWMEFKAKFGKVYKNSFEEQFRMNVYKENKRKIEEHNKKYENGEVSYYLKMNRFGDLMLHEFQKMMTGLKPERRARSNKVFEATGAELPDHVDWREKDAVTSVKDQGECGSCYAFSAAGSIEGQISLKNKKLVSVSVQQIIDCSRDYDNEGCDGGLPDSAFDYLVANGGVIDTEESYPYEDKDDQCHFNNNTIAGKITGYVDVKSEDENALQEAVATVGPVSVAINSFTISFQFYSGGIYNNPACSPQRIDHAVLAVGYGSENGTDYWIVKNSWGTKWGMDGYILMTRNQGNQCGIADLASYPLV